jgi:two-component system, NarL family, sensor kinase
LNEREGRNHYIPHVTTDADKLRQRNRELEILNVIAQALNRPIELEESLKVALASASELLGLHTGWIFLLNEDSGQPYLAASQNLPPGLASAPHLMTGGCYCLDTFRAGDLEGAANVNVVTCSRLKWLMGQGTAGLRYHSSIPLETSGRKLGVLNVASTDWRELSEEDLRILHTVGDLLSIAIERARLFALAQRLGAVEERNRLAREIHDTIAQGLAALVLRLETLDAILEADDDSARAREIVARSTELARANLDEARRSVLDLRAAPLEGKTLVDALHDLVARVERESHLEVTFESRGRAKRLPSRVELGLYRIAQEALTNITRHAGARQVRLELAVSANRARLTVEDDGHGFDIGTVDAGTHGLVGMAERAKLMGGRLELASTEGDGTRVVVSVAVEELE